MSEKTPEEIADIEKSRTISDADLLKHGGEYIITETGEKILQPSGSDWSKAWNDHAEEIIEKRQSLSPLEQEKELKKLIKQHNIEHGDIVRIFYHLRYPNGSIGGEQIIEGFFVDVSPHKLSIKRFPAGQRKVLEEWRDKIKQGKEEGRLRTESLLFDDWVITEMYVLAR